MKKPTKKILKAARVIASDLNGRLVLIAEAKDWNSYDLAREVISLLNEDWRVYGN